MYLPDYGSFLQYLFSRDMTDDDRMLIIRRKMRKDAHVERSKVEARPMVVRSGVLDTFAVYREER